MGSHEPIRGLHWQKLVALVGGLAVVALLATFCGKKEPAAPAAASPAPLVDEPARPAPDRPAAPSAPAGAARPAAVAPLDAAPLDAGGAATSDPGPTGSRGRVLEDDGERRSGAAPGGTLDKDDIQAAIRAVKPAIAKCYEGALAHDPDLTGQVVVEFTIEAVDGGGGVTAGEVSQTDMNAPFFEACVLKEVVGVPFPVPEGGGVVKVSYPFRFDSHAD